MILPACGKQGHASFGYRYRMAQGQYVVDVVIRALRKKLADNASVIETVQASVTGSVGNCECSAWRR
jgi:hypothetical protein